MKVTRIYSYQTTAEVTDGCYQCPYEEHMQEMNATIPYCAHRDSPDGYAGCTPSPNKGFPDWCPLGLGRNTPSAEPQPRQNEDRRK